MEVETFEIEEHVDGTTPELEAEAIGLIKELGLEGQDSLVKGEGETAERMQYPEMATDEKATFCALFPAKTDVKDYSAGIIPVRVLQVVAHAREFCDTIQVWHKNVRDPDPVLVGVKGPTHNPTKLFKLARWSDALDDFGEMVKEARVVIKARIKMRLESLIADHQGKLNQLDLLVENEMQGRQNYIF